MKLTNKILEKFGYIRTDRILITWDYLKCPPKANKLYERIEYYDRTKQFLVPIVLNKNNILIDGYTSYLVAKAYNKKYVKVEWR